MSFTLNRGSCRALAHTTLVWSPPAGCSGQHMLKHMISRHNDFLPMDGVITTPISTCSSYTQRRNCGWVNKHRTGRIRSRCLSFSMRVIFRFHFHFYEILMDQQRELVCSGHIIGLDASFTTSALRTHGQARICMEWTKYG